jgi:hypothetical protein
MMNLRGRCVREHRSAAHRPGRLFLLISAVVLALAASAGSASAQIFTDQATHQRFGVVPAIGARPITTACIADNTDCTALTYHGGLVMHAERFYQLIWAASGYTVPASYETGLNTFLNTMAAEDYTPATMFGVDQQFYDTVGGGKHFVPYALVNGGQIIDTNPYPANGCSDDGMAVCLNAGQLGAEVSRVAAAHHLPIGPGVEYFVFTPNGVGSCFSSGSAANGCAYTGYCGWHSYEGTAGASTETLYADMPWAAGVLGCDVNAAFGTGYPNGLSSGIDPVVGIWSHEASETMTDPNLNAWYQNGGTDSGYEDGDKCAYVYGSGGYGSMSGLSNNGSGYYNYALLGHQYLAQLEWDQRLLNCSRTNTDTQPLVSLSPTSAVHGVATTFTAHVTEHAVPVSVNKVVWFFGDGSSTTTSTNVVSHTYATAGSKTLTAVVTDLRGNERKFPVTVHVS